MNIQQTIQRHWASWLSIWRQAWKTHSLVYLGWLIIPIQKLVSRYRGWTPYWQHFSVAVVLGVLIELTIHAAHDSGPVKKVQNWVFDTTLQVFSLKPKQDVAHQRLPVLLAVDNMSAQNPDWGADEGLGLSHALKLAKHAFDRGATQVFLDYTFDKNTPSETSKSMLSEFARGYAALNTKGQTRHLYVSRSSRVDPCFPLRSDLEALRPAVWDSLPGADLANRPGLVIHSVLPHYLQDTDNKVRGWELFGVLRSESQDPNAWRVLPSPQLAYLSVLEVSKEGVASQPVTLEALGKLPWLAASSAASAKPEGTEQTPPSGLTREVFAATQLTRIGEVTGRDVLREACAHYPETLGCPTAHTPNSAHNPLAHATAQEMLTAVNALLKPLPQEYACRARAQKLLLEAGPAPTPKSQLFNRIVYTLPAWQQTNELAQRGYYLRTPLMLENDDLDWNDRLVVIGSAHSGSGDWHRTAVGEMPGSLINLNAMLSLQKIGPVSEPPAAMKLLVNLLIILTVAAVFAALSPMKAAFLSAILLLGSLMLFHEYLLTRGVWVEFGAPLLGINLHRVIDGFLAKRRLESERLLAEHRQQLAQRKLQKLKAANRRNSGQRK